VFARQAQPIDIYIQQSSYFEGEADSILAAAGIRPDHHHQISNLDRAHFTLLKTLMDTFPSATMASNSDFFAVILSRRA
jgi:hypothetical protein